MNIYQNPIRTISLGEREILHLNDLTDQNINTNEGGLIIQIFAHGAGNGNGIVPLDRRQLIPWNTVLGIVNNCRTKFRLRLDLVGVCFSQSVLQHLTPQNRIDYIWYSNAGTDWQSIYHNSRQWYNFDDFIADLLQDEQMAPYVNLFGEYPRINNILPELRT